MLNYLIAIKKPSGMTSHDVVAKLRGILSQKRIGHAGTLDPFATGVLVVGLGQATKLLERLTAEEKVYEATFAFGSETTTDDIEGEIISQEALSTEQKQRLASAEFANASLTELKTWTEQIPPSYSAVSVDGMRSYKRAWKEAKEEVEASLSARSITIYDADLLDIGESEDGETLWTVRLRVSKGTYVRSLARDLGRTLGCGAYVKALRRERSGDIDLADCITLDTLQKAKDECAQISASDERQDSERQDTLAHFLSEHALNPYEVLKMPFRYVTELDLKKARFGDSLYNTDATSAGKLVTPKPGNDVALYNEEGLWGLWKVKDQLSLVCDKNFPEPIAGVEVPYEV